MSGDYPGNATRRRRALTVVPLEPESVAAVLDDADGPGVTADPAAIRSALAQLAASNLDALQRPCLRRRSLRRRHDGRRCLAASGGRRVRRWSFRSPTRALGCRRSRHSWLRSR
jgi:hypothetical protein